jgi:hypothetical protein
MGLGFHAAPAPLPAEAYRLLARRELVLRRVAVNAVRFRPDFPAWLETNMALWESFEAQANAIWSRGRRHYSSRTLWEVMRHETLLREAAGDFKINNNFAPDVARLYLLMYPERDGFFETRGRE